jgi:hypothetical protein
LYQQLDSHCFGDLQQERQLALNAIQENILHQVNSMLALVFLGKHTDGLAALNSTHLFKKGNTRSDFWADSGSRRSDSMRDLCPKNLLYFRSLQA